MFGPYLGMRSYRRLQVRLSKGDREQLHEILSGDVQAVRMVLRALAMLLITIITFRTNSDLYLYRRVHSNAELWKLEGWYRMTSSARGAAGGEPSLKPL